MREMLRDEFQMFADVNHAFAMYVAIFYNCKNDNFQIEFSNSFHIFCSNHRF